jgi:hypothetical protein
MKSITPSRNYFVVKWQLGHPCFLTTDNKTSFLTNDIKLYSNLDAAIKKADSLIFDYKSGEKACVYGIEPNKTIKGSMLYHGKYDEEKEYEVTRKT